MSNSRSRITLASTALAVAVVTGALTAPMSYAVDGTPTSDGDLTFTARLSIGDGERACSGALVDPQWVLTAADCFTVDGGQVASGAPALPTTVTVGRNDLTSRTGRDIKVTELVAHGAGDVVLARLQSPASGITPVGIATEAPAAGEALQVAGFGRTADEWAPTRLHSASMTVASVAGDRIGLTGTADGRATICKGDAGGPAIRTDGDGTAELVALHHATSGAGCFGSDATENRATDLRVDTLADWVESTTAPVRLQAGDKLMPGDRLETATTRLVMQEDGQLLIFRKSDSALLFTTNTGNHPGAYAQMGSDGNLTVNDKSGSRLWSAGTSGSGNYAELRDNSTLTVHKPDESVLWARGGGRLQGAGSNRCLAIPASSHENNTQAIIWDCYPSPKSDGQQWTPTTAGELRVYGDKCLAAANGGTTSGTRVILWDCLGSPGQKWTHNPDGSIVNKNSGLCLDVTNGDTANSTRIQTYTCNGTPAQKWNRI